jgi:hypothetical protein
VGGGEVRLAESLPGVGANLFWINSKRVIFHHEATKTPRSTKVCDKIAAEFIAKKPMHMGTAILSIMDLQTNVFS